MSIMIDLPPQMANDVREYVTADSNALAQLLVDYLRNELVQRRNARNNPLSQFVGCIADGRRTDDVVGELRGYEQW